MYCKKRVNLISKWIHRLIKLINSLIQVKDAIFGHRNIVKWVFSSNFYQLRIFFKAKHLVEKLECLILSLCFFDSCELYLFSLKFIFCCSFCSLSRYDRVFPHCFSHLFVSHNDCTLFLQFRTTFLHHGDQLLVGIGYGNSSTED